MGVNVIFNQTKYEISQRKKEVWDRYNKIIQWGRNHPLRFAERFLGLQFTDHQKYVFLSVWNAKFATLVMSRNSGKAIALDTPIYRAKTDDKNFIEKIEYKDLSVGDYVLDEKGELTKVIFLKPIVIEQGYIVEFDDGEKITCNGEHIWYVYDMKGNDGFINIQTQQMYESLKKNKSEYQYYVPISDSELSTQNVKAIKTITLTDKPIAMRCITVENSNGLFLCGEKNTITHNSYLSAPYIMTRSILVPNHHTHIMSVTGSQSQETFKKMEDLALGQIASVSGATKVFLGELVKQNKGASGFSHDKNSWHCELYNGSEINTLNSVAKNVVGIRLIKWSHLMNSN